MGVTGRNKKCLFLSGFQTVVRKKDMTIKPAKKSFFQTETSYFVSFIN